MHSQSPILESWIALESWRSWTLPVFTSVADFYPSPTTPREHSGESEEDGEHSLQIMYLQLVLVPFFSVADTEVPVIEDVTRLVQQISLNTARACCFGYYLALFCMAYHLG